MAESYDIALVRVDNRLVHGQILEAWVPHIEAECIMVVDDNSAADFFCETVIRMAVPSHIEVNICTVEDFASLFLCAWQGKENYRFVCQYRRRPQGS